MALFTDGVAGIHDGDVSIQFPGMVRDWYQSSPLSLGGWIARWFIALPLLTAVGIIVGTIALIKVLSWLACMPLAATMYALVSMRFSTTATE